MERPFRVAPGEAEASRYTLTADSRCPTTLFLIDARSPGITINPLLTIADDRQNEVILENVVVPEASLVG